MKGWILLSAYVMHSVFGDSRLLPKDAHHAALVQGKDCAVFRSLVHEAQKEVEDGRKMLEAEFGILKERRQELEQCASEKGILFSKGQETEVLLAELCTDAYESWLSPSYRVQFLKQDIQDALEMLTAASLQLRQYCRSIPPNVIPSSVTK